MVSRGRAKEKHQAITVHGDGPPPGVASGAELFGQSPESPLGQTFAGWESLSDLISPLNNELSDAMSSLAGTLRAGIEYHAARRFNEIRSVLRAAGAPALGIAQIERFFLSERSNRTSGELAEMTRLRLDELTRSGVISHERPPGPAFFSSVIRHARRAIHGQGVQPGLLAEFSGVFMPATRFRVVASLELRQFSSGADFSIWCRKPLRWRGDSLVVTEHTYTQRDVCGLTNARFKGHPVKEVYRSDIDQLLPPDFMESIDEGRPVDQYYYSYEIISQRRSRAERRMRSILERSRHEIQAILRPVVDAGIAMAELAATIHGVPIEVVKPLIQPFDRIAENGIQALLLRDIAMTPWGITHTTLNTPEFPDDPLSMFTLISTAATTAKLHRVCRDASDPNISVMDLDYSEKVRSNQRSRAMIGSSIPPAQSCPSDLWEHVAQKNQPAVWTEPGQDNGGFRILVPHAEIGRKTSYVSALRADVVRVSDDQS